MESKTRKWMCVLLVAITGVVFSNNAKAGLLFGVTFDEGLNADIAGGNGTAYKSITDDPATLKRTTDYSVFGGASLDPKAAYGYLTYRTPGNIDLTKGTLEMFLHPHSIPGLEATATAYLLNVGKNNVLGINVAWSPLWGVDKPRLMVYWNGVNVTPSGMGIYAPDHFKADQWNHVAITWDMTGEIGAGVLKVYAGGAQIFSKTDLNPATALEQESMWFGSYHASGSGQFRGYVDDIGIYDDVIYTGPYTVRTTSVTVPEPVTVGMLWIGMAFGGLCRNRKGSAIAVNR